MSYEVVKPAKGGLVKMWTKGVPVGEEALRQVENVSSLPFLFKHVAVMPDVHWGMGATVGCVLPTKGAIIPAAVGVDIGCGMMAVRTDLSASDLPESLSGLRSAIEQAVPHGRTSDGRDGDEGAWSDPPEPVRQKWTTLAEEHKGLVSKHSKLTRGRTIEHLGTLGTGNHFIEVCLDQNDRVWAMLHSGSRGIGNLIGTYFIEKAKQDMRRWFINLPDEDLAYIPEGSPNFGDYVRAVSWVRPAEPRADDGGDPGGAAFDARPGRARAGRGRELPPQLHREGRALRRVGVGDAEGCRARLGIIPGSMGARSYIVRGKGNRESFMSCSHGAGRAMSRNEAKRRFTIEDHAKATEGIECRKDAEVLDETPAAYKPIDAVMAAQADLVDAIHTLRQVVCVKG